MTSKLSNMISHFLWLFLIFLNVHSFFKFDNDRKTKNKNSRNCSRVYINTDIPARKKKQNKTVTWHLILKKLCFSSNLFLKCSKENKTFQRQIAKIAFWPVISKEACCNVNWTNILKRRELGVSWDEWLYNNFPDVNSSEKTTRHPRNSVIYLCLSIETGKEKEVRSPCGEQRAVCAAVSLSRTLSLQVPQSPSGTCKQQAIVQEATLQIKNLR